MTNFNQQPASDIDYEALLAQEGLGANLEAQGEPMGDSLEVADPRAARSRASQADLETESSSIFDTTDETDGER